MNYWIPLAVVFGIVGVVLSSGAGIGAALVGCGCILAILARIKQANDQHEHMLQGLTALLNKGQKESASE